MAQERSALDEALTRVGDRWTLMIVDTLLAGPRRFGQLLEELPGLAPNVLTRRLRALEHEGLVITTPYSRRPPRFAYALTAAGAELAGALRLLAQWGAGQSPDTVEPLRHSPCGTPLEARWWCPTCDLPIDDPDNEGELRFV